MYSCHDRQQLSTQDTSCQTTRRPSAVVTKMSPTPTALSRAPLRGPTPINASHRTSEDSRLQVSPHHLVGVKRRQCSTSRQCAIVLFCLTIVMSSDDYFLPTSKCHSYHQQQQQQQSTISDTHRRSLIGQVDALLQQVPPVLSSPANTIYLQTNLTDSSSPLASQASSIQRRDLDSVGRQQQDQKSRPPVAAPTIGNVCQVNDGESVAIVEIEESRGSDMSQMTNPNELPISGSVELGEIELKIESETHKYFRIQNKSLALTRPLDRDAVMRENSTQILQQAITSIYLQISCIDKRVQQQRGSSGNSNSRARKVIIPVLVKVLDLNDQAPKFTQPVYSIQVNELAPVGTVILDQIAYAIDLDSANNGQIEYRLLGQAVPQASSTTPAMQTSGSTSSTSAASNYNWRDRSKTPLLAQLSQQVASTNQRLIQRAPLGDGQQNRISANKMQVATTTTTNVPISSTVITPTTGSNSDDDDGDNDNDEVTGSGNQHNSASSPPSYPSRANSIDSSLAASSNSPTSTQDDSSQTLSSLKPAEVVPAIAGDNSSDQPTASVSASTATSAYRNATPTINLNSEPILNGPMDEIDEDESDEALLASMNLNNNSSDPDAPDQPDLAGADTVLPLILAGDSSSSSSLEQARKRVLSNYNDNSDDSAPIRRRYTRRRRRSRRHAPTVSTTIASAADLATTMGDHRARNRQPIATTTMAMTTRPTGPASDQATATTTPNPPWTNLMVIPNTSDDFQLSADSAARNQLDELTAGNDNSNSYDNDSGEFFALELAPLTGRPVIKLKKQLDYETKRVHKLTLVATDRATNKHERLTSQVKIVIRVLDGDDQPPAFILDQVGCATGSLPHPTTPIPAAPTTTATASSIAASNSQAMTATTSPADMDLLQVDSIGGKRTKQVTKLVAVPGGGGGADLVAAASSNSQQLRSFRVSDENFDFGDTLDLDDMPLDDQPQSAASGAPSNSSATRARRVSPGPTDQQQQQLQNGATAAPRPLQQGVGTKSRQHDAMADYLCLAPTQQLQQQQTKSLGAGSGQLTIEYFATVISGDSDYLLRIAPQSIKAHDRDELNAPIRYSFINGTPANYSQYFHINPVDATIKQIQPIERTQVNEFELYVKAEEQSYNKLFSVAKLTIDVLPTDKSPPVLMPNSYYGFVDENSPLGTRVLVTRASAPDQPSGSSNATSPTVHMRINVVDVDSSVRNQKDTNNNANGQRQSSGQGVSGTSAAAAAGQSSTGSAKQLVSYEFETTSDAFKVDRDGYVYVNKFPLDRDGPSQAVHMFQVTAHQVGLLSAKSKSSPVSLNVTLLDQNDNAPALLNSTLSPVQIPANSRGGVQFVSQILATDKDSPEHSRMHFSIVHVSNNGAQRFRMDEQSGRIEALGKFQAGEQFSLLVQVADELGRWSQGILDVQVVPGANTGGPQFVIDGQERGDNSRGYSVDINEGIAVNSIVLQVRAVDPENDPITYSLIDGNINGDFSINSKTGALLVANKLDREEISAYKLIVQARDSGGLATSRPIHVTISDSNDQNPVFNQAHYVFAVEEGASGGPNGLLLGRVSAQDGDEGDNGRVSYSLLSLKPAYAGTSGGGDDDNDGSASGGAGYEFVEVGAVGGAKRDSKHDDGDDVQADGRLGQRNVATTGPADKSRTGSSSRSMFSMDDKTGELRLMEPLDYERARSHTLLVVARDNGENPRSSSASVQVKVVDKQDEAPYFERYHIETRLDENLAGHRVALVQARDPDSVAQISYVLLAGDSSLFQMDPQTGLVSTLAGLDYEEARLHTLLVGTNESLSAPDGSRLDLASVAQKLSDTIAEASSSSISAGSQHQNSASVATSSSNNNRWPIVRIDVHVNDLNDNAPQFDSPHPLPVRIQDSVPLGTILGARLQAHDRDGSAPNNQIRYELVVAPGGVGASSSNDDATHHHHHQQRQTGTSGASEPVTSDKCAQLFLVDPTSGQVSVRADLRRDSLSECQLVVRARDLPVASVPSAAPPPPNKAASPNQVDMVSGGSLSSTSVLTVFIDHLAEISPASMVSFADTSYFVELAENAPANTLVKLLPIINKPRAAFPMSCELISGNELNKFYIIENELRDCELKTRDNSLDFELKQRYNLMVKLNTIGGSSSRATLAQVQVNIVDKNDNRPVFSQPARYSHLTQMRFLAAIASDSPSDTQVLQVRASDADSSQANGLISYELLNDQELEGRFKVDPIDGIIRTSRPIEDIPATRLPVKLKVLARDNPEQASESLESTAEIVVNLIDDNYRIGLVLKDTPAGRVLDNKEELLAVLQERTGLISGLERVESLKVLRNTTRPVVEADVSGTDFWFYLIEPGTLRLVPNDDQRLKGALFEARAQNSLADIVGQQLGFARVRVRLPYSLTSSSGASGGGGGGGGSLISNSLAALSGPSNLLFGTIRADSSDRLAPVLILVALFIAIISAIVLIYQCGSSAGWSESTAIAANSASMHHHHQQALQYQHQQHFGKDKFLFSPPPPPPGAYQLTTGRAQSPLGSQLAGVDARFGVADPYGMGATFATDGGVVPVGAINYSSTDQQQQQLDHEQALYLGGSAQAKEYETQMLKMSVLFDDSQSFDEHNLADQNLNKNLM